MSKYIIEIDDTPFYQEVYYEDTDWGAKIKAGERKLYKAKNFNTLVFDQNGLDKLEPYVELNKKDTNDYKLDAVNILELQKFIKDYIDSYFDM